MTIGTIQSCECIQKRHAKSKCGGGEQKGVKYMNKNNENRLFFFLNTEANKTPKVSLLLLLLMR